MNVTDVDDKIILRARRNHLLAQYRAAAQVGAPRHRAAVGCGCTAALRLLSCAASASLRAVTAACMALLFRWPPCQLLAAG